MLANPSQQDQEPFEAAEINPDSWRQWIGHHPDAVVAAIYASKVDGLPTLEAYRFALSDIPPEKRQRIKEWQYQLTTQYSPELRQCQQTLKALSNICSHANPEDLSAAILATGELMDKSDFKIFRHLSWQLVTSNYPFAGIIIGLAMRENYRHPRDGAALIRQSISIMEEEPSKFKAWENKCLEMKDLLNSQT